MEGDAGQVQVDEEGDLGDNRWCFACACRGCANPLGDTDTACDVNAMCMSHALMMLLVSPVLAPHLSRSPNPIERFMHSTLRGSLAAFGLSTKME